MSMEPVPDSMSVICHNGSIFYPPQTAQKVYFNEVIGHVRKKTSGAFVYRKEVAETVHGVTG